VRRDTLARGSIEIGSGLSIPAAERKAVSDTAFSLAIVAVTVVATLVAIRAAWRLLNYQPGKSRKP
jgi:hypothetical protein